MAKIKLTKNELKLQRDALKRFQRYLPTLQLKKQQLQMEVRQARERVASLAAEQEGNLAANAPLLALLAGDEEQGLEKAIQVVEWRVALRNVAGTDVPVFDGLEAKIQQADLFESPLWMDDAVALLQKQSELRLRLLLAREQLAKIEEELHVVTQRVNLFEKVKIPDAQENIRRINIYIGDQQTNSVGRSKIAKAKCQVRDAAMA